MADMNKGAKMGITDKDYIEELGLDPALEGKPEINDAIRAKLREQLATRYAQSGVRPDQAMDMARKAIK